mgnify:CR=1 FL=1
MKKGFKSDSVTSLKTGSIETDSDVVDSNDEEAVRIHRDKQIIESSSEEDDDEKWSKHTSQSSTWLTPDGQKSKK